MNIRASQIYVTRTTRRMLSAIARAEGGESSADSVGERLLSETLKRDYAALILIQTEIDALESRMVQAVKRS